MVPKALLGAGLQVSLQKAEGAFKKSLRIFPPGGWPEEEGEGQALRLLSQEGAASS
jgi:hypothetical protein